MFVAPVTVGDNVPQVRPNSAGVVYPAQHTVEIGNHCSGNVNGASRQIN